jgi:acyl transferase domain-containing protein
VPPPQVAASERIAIVGMSARYPEAPTLDQFWSNLADARCSIREIPRDRWNVDRYFDPRGAERGKVYCRWLGALGDVDRFEPLFFHISAAEAELMDPQQRLFLEEAYRAFEDAGYSPRSLGQQRCGVYLGLMGNEYAALVQRAEGFQDATGNSAAIAAARIAYFLNLKGPAITLDTACSSSLVATHLACRALVGAEVDMALVGGVTLYLTEQPYISMCAVGMLAKDGRCKAFDDTADGFVPGEGVGTLVLKRLADAERDGDSIYGVIIGSGINQDGRTNGITAPSVASQMDLLRDVYRRFSIDPETISYVEAHGTGTKLGDPIELEALSTVFREYTRRERYCGIGSVKSNIGHTSAAAGIAGVHKVLLALKNTTIPATLHCAKPNEHFDFAASPFYVNAESRKWEVPPGTVRRAAVSSFGISGTNAHIVIEEYVPRHAEAARLSRERADRAALIVLSARSGPQLKMQASALAERLRSMAESDLASIAYTLQIGREEFEHRLAFPATSVTEAADTLQRYVANGSADVAVGHVARSRACCARGSTVTRSRRSRPGGFGACTSGGSTCTATARFAERACRRIRLRGNAIGSMGPMGRGVAEPSSTAANGVPLRRPCTRCCTGTLPI